MSDFDDIQALWKRQPTTVPEVDMDMIKKNANRFHNQILLRNLSEWLACAFLVVCFTVVALDADFHVVSRVGAILNALGAALVGHRLMLDGRLKKMPDAAQDTQGYLAAYRNNVLQQAQLTHDVWRWYLAPLSPGLIVFMVGVMLAEPASWTLVVPIMLGIAAAFVGIHFLNRLAAKKMREKVEEL